MPIKQSAKKYVRSTSAKTSQNNARKREFRNAIKNVMELIRDDKYDQARKAFIKAQKALDKAAKTGVIKKNTASRKKSRLVKRLVSMKK